MQREQCPQRLAQQTVDSALDLLQEARAIGADLLRRDTHPVHLLPVLQVRVGPGPPGDQPCRLDRFKAIGGRPDYARPEQLFLGERGHYSE